MEFIAEFTVNCNFCGSSDAQLRYVLRDLRLGLSTEYQFMQCKQCGLWYLTPIPSVELEQYYPDQYAPFHQESASNSWGVLHYGMRRRRQAVLRYQQSGCLLDLGCATGDFLNEMRVSGQWQVYGVEPISLPAQIARDRFALEVFVGKLEEANFTENYFDVITLWDVLEHVPNPSTTLSEIWRILKPGGWLFIQTPDPDSWEPRLFGPSWMGWDAPRHLYMFPRTVLMRYLGKNGFRVIKVQSIAGNVSTALVSLGYWYDLRGMNRTSQWIQRLARSAWTRGVTAPLYFALRHFNLTFSLLYVAQKSENK